MKFVSWFFLKFTILWSLRYVLAFEIPYIESGIPIWTEETLKHLTRWYESTFEFSKFPVYDLVFLATSAAFLALMALKLKNIQIC